jgi:3'(2'), 5'-bisphosphate nucleotidase
MTDDAALAERLATEAGGLLLELRRANPDLPPRALGDQADRAAHDFLMSELARERPQDVRFSEEAAAPDARLSAARVWIVDPLDGTREYSEGRDDFAVHVALVERGRPLVGALGLPGRGRTLVSSHPPPLPTPRDRPRIVVSRSRPPPLAQRVAEAISGELCPMGSAGAKVGAVLLGEAELYLHAGGFYEWDTCAPVAVALAAGFHATRIDGEPLVYNQKSPWCPDLLVCHPKLAARVLAVIAEG